MSAPSGPLARAYVALQHALPQHLLSSLMHGLARVEWAPIRVPLVRLFVALTGIRMEESEQPDPGAYPHLNALFTRRLRPGLRPVDPDPGAVLAPVDGVLSQLGRIKDGRLIQAKGLDYSVADLLGVPAGSGHPFEGGDFATLYLSPKDYHRIHMPLAGDLTAMVHRDGRLFAVNAITAGLVPGLFARNERVICRFDTQVGPMALVLVGAIFVGGIETVWAGPVTPARASDPKRRATGQVRLEAGAEMGRFNLGSTVILLFPPGAVSWDPALAPGSPVRFGQRIGRRDRVASSE